MSIQFVLSNAVKNDGKSFSVSQHLTIQRLLKDLGLTKIIPSKIPMFGQIVRCELRRELLEILLYG